MPATLFPPQKIETFFFLFLSSIHTRWTAKSQLMENFRFVSRVVTWRSRTFEISRKKETTSNQDKKKIQKIAEG